jgi:hypothetical protein
MEDLFISRSLTIEKPESPLMEKASCGWGPQGCFIGHLSMVISHLENPAD